MHVRQLLLQYEYMITVRIPTWSSVSQGRSPVRTSYILCSGLLAVLKYSTRTTHILLLCGTAATAVLCIMCSKGHGGASTLEVGDMRSFYVYVRVVLKMNNRSTSAHVTLLAALVP